ncbi:endonuclease/exonuclease/phosphatase family protein [Pelagicoccus mobilis]|uniref:Endonuclease/exonuclease/phosphatase family protein n=1 Tax=Pelagicoccus mobilis TaxID=415221 RepID=A0A934S305_9BACT|nr:endonuclease/exonuclease/phosphatase family protein [Pelagicoccus mobilis]MBK1878484.1 endonuclease/exonuclease/phosphatase family protein [Pelagicoccus mobilis]
MPPNTPYFLMGDLNAIPETPEIKLLSQSMNDTRIHSEVTVFGQSGTFNGFNPSVAPTRRIDYIFASRDSIRVISYATFSDLVDQRFPSDHFPVVARCELLKK